MLREEEDEVYDTTGEIAMDLGVDEEDLQAQLCCPHGQPTVDEEGNLISCEQCGRCGDELPF